MIYEYDSLNVLKHFGKAVCQCLLHEKNLKIVKDIAQWEGKTIDKVKNLKVNGLSITTIQVAIQQATHALPGVRPAPIVKNHLDTENPYELLYGSAWKEKNLKTPMMK